VIELLQYLLLDIVQSQSVIYVIVLC